ncbi:MAG: ribosome small subunit-dependent GTPase A [Rhodothermia bacterium]|nr:ribosome small subunit-dependent GTPase A [Rhodothermia bacterium]
MPEGLEEGVVFKSTGSWYEVSTSSGSVPCKVPGRFRLTHKGETNPLAVGDHVMIRILEDSTGIINKVKPRKNKLVRRAAGRRVGVEHVIVANVDFAWVVQSTLLPKLNPGFVDRFLVMSEVYGIPAGLIINKYDLVDDRIREPVEYWCRLYADIGYPVLRTSAVAGEGIEVLRSNLQDRMTVMAGPSGVGKSSLLNAIDPSLQLRTGEVSERTRKGVHVTTNAEIYQLAEGGFVIDTPGIREYGIVDVEPEELGHYFVEFIPWLDECHYPNCTHDHEPDCAVIDAVDRGKITQERWASYLNILESIRQGERDTGR